MNVTVFIFYVILNKREVMLGRTGSERAWRTKPTGRLLAMRKRLWRCAKFCINRVRRHRQLSGQLNGRTAILGELQRPEKL